MRQFISRFGHLWLVAVLGAVAFTACSPVSACNASNCPSGCCDARGVCQGASVSTCGVSGSACVDCGFGRTCVFGTCSVVSNGNSGGGAASGGGSANGGGGEAGGGSSSGGGGATGGGSASGGGTAQCLVTCPMGFTCNSNGACAGGPLNAIVLNEELPVSVSGVVQVNGAPFTYDASYCQGNATGKLANVWFVEATKGYSQTAYVTCASAPAFTAQLPRGTWRVRVAENTTYAGTNLVDVNYEANAALSVTGAISGLVLNEELPVTVSGVVQVNGAPFTYDASYCQGNATGKLANVWFVEATKGYSQTVYVTCASAPAFTAQLPRGTWRVRVAENTTYAGTNLVDVNYEANAALSVTGAISGLVLNEELPVTVSGVVQVNGAPFTYDASYCQGNATGKLANVWFVEETKGYSQTAYVTCASAPAFTAQLPRGTWRVRVAENTTYAGTNLVDVNYEAYAALSVTGAISGLVLNEELPVTVSGVVQVNGAPFTYDASYCQGNATGKLANVWFVEATKGYSQTVYVTCASAPAFTAQLPRGTWRVRVAENTTYAGTNLVDVNYEANAALSVTGAISGLVLNEELPVSVSGVVQVNGAPFTYDASYCQGNATGKLANVWFVEETKGYSQTAYVTCASAPGFTAQLPRGTWRVRVAENTTYAGTNLVDVNYEAVARLVVQ